MRLVFRLFIILFGFGSVASQAQLLTAASMESKVQAQVKEDLAFLGSIKSNHSSPFHVQFLGQVNGEDYLRWVNQRIYNYQYHAAKGGDQTTFAYYKPGGAYMLYVTENYFKYSLPQIFRLSLIIHEARHAENIDGAWPHATCPIPFVDSNKNDVIGYFTHAKMEGTSACDDQIGGSYSLAAIFLLNIAQNANNVTEKVKLDAKIFGEDTLKRVIPVQSQIKIKKDLKSIQ